MRVFYWAIVACLLAAPLEASLVDLSTLTNLNDTNDDTAAFESAIVMAGEGGGLLIPQGQALLSKSVTIAHSRFTLLGNGSRVVFSEGGGLEMTAASSARYTIRNLGFSVTSGVSTNPVRLLATKGRGRRINALYAMCRSRPNTVPGRTPAQVTRYGPAFPWT